MDGLKKPAKFWEKLSDKKVRCWLCPWRCAIPSGKLGVCRSRKNEDGGLHTLTYGSIASMAADPIEKKPLYHFWPGTNAFSIAAPGCNLKCLHCQNWTISQANIGEVPHEDISPKRLIELTKHHKCKGIAHTYSEPTIWTEYAIDVGKLAHREGLYNVYVTNGYITPEALKELGPHLDAANVDVKAFSDGFYKKLCGVPSMKPVLDTCEWMVKHGIHLEVTFLVIPRENDSPKEIQKFCKWVLEKLGPEVPTHFSRFYPHHKLTDHEPTPVKTLERAMGIAKEAGLHHVYIGNVSGHPSDNTYCPSCGELLINRYGFEITEHRLKGRKCLKCGTEINIVGECGQSP